MTGSDVDERADWMKALSGVPADLLGDVWMAAGIDAQATNVRGPEIGLVTVRGRIGGSGAPFNLGETTVTRISVRLNSGEVGHAYTLGRDAEKARICAIVDALWLQGEMRETLRRDVILPVQGALERQDDKARAQAAATKVDFFTLVRGDD